MAEEQNKRPKSKKALVGILLFIVAVLFYVTIVLKIKYVGP